MGTIKGQGAPLRDTKGCIGDIYTDITTGRKYKCTNSYGVYGNFDYTWRLIQGNEKAAPVKEQVKPIPKEEPKVESVPAVEEIKEVEEPVVEEPVKQPKKTQKKESNQEQSDVTTKRTDYAAAYNKSK